MASTNFTYSSTYPNCEIPQSPVTMVGQKEQHFAYYNRPCYVEEESAASNSTAPAPVEPYYINRINSNDGDLSLFTVESLLSSAENEVSVEDQHQHHQQQQHCSINSNAEDSKLATEERLLKTIHDLKHEMCILKRELHDLKSTATISSKEIEKRGRFTGEIEKRGRWTDEEHKLFLEGYKLFGRKWKKVAKIVGTRNLVQTRTHAQKYFKGLAKLSDKKRKRDAKKTVPDLRSTDHCTPRDRNSGSILLTTSNSAIESTVIASRPALHSNLHQPVTPTSAMDIDIASHTTSSVDGQIIQASPAEPIFKNIPPLPSISVCSQEQKQEVVPSSITTKEWVLDSPEWDQSEIEELTETLELLETIC